MYNYENSKSLQNEDVISLQDQNDPAINQKCVEEFYYSILDSPELYPYFMDFSRNRLWTMCNKMARYITHLLNKNLITPADTEHIKKTHYNLNIDETSYDAFTSLFTHICCRNKNDARRKKMISMFSLLKAHICPSASKRKNLAALCSVISNLQPVAWKEELDEKQGCTWLDNFEPNEDYLCISNIELSRSEMWNEQAQYFHLRKRLRDLKKLITVIHYKSMRMEMRITNLEMKSREQQMLANQNRDLDLVLSHLAVLKK